MGHTISFWGKTDMGKIRTNNEDAYIVQKIWDENHILAVAIDGVGGYDGGEVAAEIAQKTIVEYLQEYPNGERLELLKQAVIEANNKIFEERTVQTQFANMSCVLTACLVEVARKQINMVHVGDTRLYQYWHNKLEKLSHDHSLVGYREEVGDLSEDEAMNHPQRNVINRDIGSGRHETNDEDFLDSAVFPLQPNSTLLLCSDGLCDMVKSSEMVSVLADTRTLDDKVQQLIELANQKGGKDNITAVLVEYQSDEQEPVGIENENVQPNIRVETIDESKSKTGKMKKLTIASVMFIVLAIAFTGGWFSKSYYDKSKSMQFQPKTSVNNPTNEIPTDTIEVRKDTVISIPVDICKMNNKQLFIKVLNEPK
ncbi:PP2C family protein-serine/threonine phosphatase [Dysgonomonas termitidis]|uniref:PP2C family protein-serine/threonine phosphatase n=1 Tax=Dysgonomonas termitidis TaxID=1516126 RepID=A0ABV9L561_9BACT